MDRWMDGRVYGEREGKRKAGMNRGVDKWMVG